VANWVTGELAAALREAKENDVEPKITFRSLAALIELVQRKKISHGSGKTVLAKLVEEGGDPEAIVEREGLAQISSDDGELASIVEQAMADNAAAVEKIREGNEKAIGAIVGAVMRETKGRADGGEVNRLIKERL
jgi:aspartyl-tRNA(Asn)/glutamyl-tRNA(Gln) amidotransferase subunit B